MQKILVLSIISFFLFNSVSFSSALEEEYELKGDFPNPPVGDPFEELAESLDNLKQFFPDDNKDVAESVDKEPKIFHSLSQLEQFLDKYGEKEEITTPLILNGEWVTDEVIKKVGNATHLDLTYSGVTDKGLPYLKKATTLNLSFTYVTNKGMKHIPQVVDLDMFHTAITDEGLEPLINLKRIDVTWCFLSDGAKARLQERGVDVYY